MEKAEIALLIVSVLVAILLGFLVAAYRRGDRLEDERDAARRRYEAAQADLKRLWVANDVLLADSKAVASDRSSALTALAVLKADLLRLAQAEPPVKVAPNPAVQMVKVVPGDYAGVTAVIQPLVGTTCVFDPARGIGSTHHGPVWVTGTVSCLPAGVTVARESGR